MKQNNSEYELIVSEGKLPIWRVLLAASFFTGLIYLLYLIGLIFYRYGFDIKVAKPLASTVKLCSLCLAGGISFSMTKTILIDVDRDKLISRYTLGPFSKDALSKVPQLEYVSVFLNAKEFYEVNIWYNRNRHYNMYCFDDKESAMKLAASTAIKLNLDLLDATVKGNSEWIDKNTI
jgi:hypothetical protein